jgi:transposase
MNLTWVGIDDHADSLVVAVFRGIEKEPVAEFKLPNDVTGQRQLLRKLEEIGGEARVVYEAGPCGYGLCRWLLSKRVSCEIAAPSLTPRRPGDRVKTNRRDARKLATLYRAGELTLIAIPSPEREAAREISRGRDAARKDLLRKRHQLSKFLLRHGRRARGMRGWSVRHWNWIKAQTFDDVHLKIAHADLMASVQSASESLARWDAGLRAIAESEPYRPYVNAFRVLRGYETISAITLLLELGDLRRFNSASALMKALGITPGEVSTGEKQTHLSITKTGNARARFVVVEAAWHYTKRPISGKAIALRRKDQPPEIVAIAQKADQRLYRRYWHLVHRGKKATIAATAIARELAGFLWAIGQQLPPLPR